MKKENSSKRVWFITGTSHGFGHDLVRIALERGDCVVATSRTPEKVAAEFEEEKDRLLAVPLDFRDQAQIESTVKKAITRFGHVDVLINNAGHGLLGAVEEASDAEIANIYETNVFGLIRVTRALLPYFRNQHRGNIVNISSIAGLVGIAGWGIYSSTKFAVEGLSEALAKEVAPLGIHVTIVEPGPFRTNFLGSSLTETIKRISDYDSTAGATRKTANESKKGTQPGDPVLAAEAIIKAVTSEKPPLHLLLGGLAYDLANTKLEELRDEFGTWRETALATDYRS